MFNVHPPLTMPMALARCDHLPSRIVCTGMLWSVQSKLEFGEFWASLHYYCWCHVLPPEHCCCHEGVFFGWSKYISEFHEWGFPDRYIWQQVFTPYVGCLCSLCPMTYCLCQPVFPVLVALNILSELTFYQTISKPTPNCCWFKSDVRYMDQTVKIHTI